MLASSIKDGPDLREPTYLSAFQIRHRYGLDRLHLLNHVAPDITVPWGGPDRRVGRWLPETVERYLSDRAEAKARAAREQVERRAARAEVLAEAKARAARERLERRSACVEEHPVEIAGRAL